MATRRLRVEEPGEAEVLTVDFDDAKVIPRLNSDWRWEDQDQALLIACSSLIATDKAGASRIVQFSHFSVKEFPTPPRLAAANGEVSSYYINLEPSHATLAQVYLGVFLQIPDDVERVYTQRLPTCSIRRQVLDNSCAIWRREVDRR